MVNVIFLKGPDMFAEFGRVSVFCVLEQCSVVSVSSLEVVFCKSDVCLSSGVVLTCNSGLVEAVPASLRPFPSPAKTLTA